MPQESIKIPKKVFVSHRTYRPKINLSKKIQALRQGFNFTEGDLADIFDVNKRTITRWKVHNEELSRQRADRIEVLGSILALGKGIFGTEDKVKRWMYTPVLSIEGKKPIDLVKTESGRRRVENVLLQIEGGVY